MRGMLTVIGILTLTATSCATVPTAAQSERDRIVLEGRIDDLEAAQLRYRTRVTSLEKRLEQLNEKLDLLGRRSSFEQREVVRIEPTQDRRLEMVSPSEQRTAELEKDDVYQEIVVTDAQKRAYFGQGSRRSVASTGARKPYDTVVTNDRLPALGAQAAVAAKNVLPASPMTHYQEGIDLYRRGLYDEARLRFEQFLATKPELEYIDNALYWIGECYYGVGLFNEAASYFHKIVQEYPTTNKVPDALLKVSLTYQQLGRMDSAREMLRYLMEAFPNSEAARLGKEKYEAMK